MPHLVAIETCAFGFCSKISLGLAPFERSPLLHKTSFWFGPRALELFGLILGWATLPLVPFSFVPWLFVKEVVVLLEPEFVTPPHIREVMALDNEAGQLSSSFRLAQVGSSITNWHTRSNSGMCRILSMSSE
jgi:hypothetical protein